jgi:O-antigen/teichoic acid export membrane protein
MIIVTFGRIGQIFLTFLTVRIATTILPPDEMARIFLISSAVTFFAATLINPVGMFINRRLYAWNLTGKVRRYVNYFWLYLLVVSFIAAGLMIILVGANLLTFHTGLVWLLFLIFGSLMISTMNLTIIPGLNLLGYQAWFAYLTLATTAMSLVMAVLMVMLVKPGAEYWMVGLLLGQLLIGLVGVKVFYKRIKSPASEEEPEIGVKRNHVKLLWKFAYPILIGAVLIWTQTQSYRFFMERSLGLVEVGLFVAGYGISAAILAAFESVFTTYFQPIFYRDISREDIAEQGRAWTNYAGAILPSLLLVGFFVIATAPELTKLMLGSAYRDSSQFVVWGVIAELARVSSGVYGMVAHARMNTKLLLLPSIIGVIVSITMILWLMPKYGAVGVGVALALAGISVFVATYLATRTELITTLPYRTLVKGLVVGVLLVAVDTMVRRIMGKEGMVFALLLLGFSAIIFLSTQYWMLRTLLHRNDKTND